jgi:hypothetical protein
MLKPAVRNQAARMVDVLSDSMRTVGLALRANLLAPVERTTASTYEIVAAVKGGLKIETISIHNPRHRD